jgi:hypothetical protein
VAKDRRKGPNDILHNKAGRFLELRVGFCQIVLQILNSFSFCFIFLELQDINQVPMS